MTTALVTGAGGFIGRHLTRHLERMGQRVRRVSSQPDVATEAGVDLLDFDESRLARVLEGVDVVHFLAGIAHEVLAARDPDGLQRVNVTAPRVWLRAADRAGVAQFVWLSSIKVLGDRSERPFSPEDPYRPGDPYAASKVEAEQRLLDEPLRTTALAVVRPPLVYGPGTRSSFAPLLRLADSPWPLPFGAARAPRSLVAVGNLNDLLVRLGQGGSGIFHVADGEDLTVSGLIGELRRAFGRPSRQVDVPPAWIRRALVLAGQGRIAQRLFEPLQVDIEATRQRLGWSPPVTVAEALREMAEWFRSSR
ncbi:MAG TPA: NAD-dependent epimerase/dehydratase family protein [Pseudomonadales bacterium]